MQWNFGQGTLPPLLKKMESKNAALFNECFGGDNAKLNSFSDMLDTTTAEQLEWAAGIQANNKVNSEWKTIFDKIGDKKEFQSIQDSEAIAMNHPLAIEKIKWLRSKYPEHFERVTLRSYVALFDLSNQHGRLKDSVMNKLVEYWKSNPPKSQFEVVEKTCIFRGLAGKSEFRADSISRRLGILKGKTVKADATVDNLIVGSSERTNSKYTLLTPNKLIKGLEL